MVHLDGPRDPREDHPRGVRSQGGVLTSGEETSSDALLARLRAEAGDAPLPPLRITTGGSSTRPGPAGRVVDAVRRVVLRLIAPSLGEMLNQLERDRHRTRAELVELKRRIADLEAGTPRRDG